MQVNNLHATRPYQAFRWWGIGTTGISQVLPLATLSGFPMVGYRNSQQRHQRQQADLIRLSDGGVSERWHNNVYSNEGPYQAFRWWGIGTSDFGDPEGGEDLIRLSDGGVSERQLE